MARGKNKTKRRPASPAERPESKTPGVIAGNSDAWRDQLFHWSCNYIWHEDSSHKWCFGNVTFSAFFSEIYPRLKDFQSMRWREILKNSHHHHWQLNKLDKEVRDLFITMRGAIDLGTDEIYQFHVKGKHVILGIRDGSVFHLMWNDIDHQIYPTKKRNT